uniref:Uncharacterized protein n=1 Tax=Pyramimonas orientalis virus TaxID=455367 RepID=A0A7M3UPD4_POV01|nr:hypothetical protein HWQ62_00486 [Pyramimonas orientalis virus]
MSLTYVTKDKFNLYKDKIEELGLVKEMEENILRLFQESFEYDPEKSTYSSEKYKQNREYHLKKTNGERGYPESKLKAVNKYNENNREEVNRKRRERYQRTKDLLKKECAQVNLTTFA